MLISHAEMVARMVVALVLGGVVGFERGHSEHPAGMRTHMLVALASATFMLVSTHFVFFQHYPLNGLVHVDTSRIASGVVMGIGFLGAGSIMRTGLAVHGLTTAASLWLVTAVGLAAGSGMYTVAILSTVASVLVLAGLTAIEDRYKRKIRCRIRIDFDPEATSRPAILERLEAQAVEVFDVTYESEIQSRRSRMTVEAVLPAAECIEPLMSSLEMAAGIHRVEVNQQERSS